jgi:hypothetical protein
MAMESKQTQTHSHGARLMKQMIVGLLVATVLVNVPLNRYGTTLATALPDSASLVIRDGLVIKEENDKEIYVYQDGQFRWISNMATFEAYGFVWGDVRVVGDGFLDPFEIGPPLSLLAKCKSSPHVYVLEGENKRWIRDIDTFVAEGYKWEDVQIVSCKTLRDLPDGETIPPDAGPPAQP